LTVKVVVENDIAADSDEPVPKALTAFSFTEYVVPKTKPEIVIGLEPSAGESAVKSP